jgi:hypothetical protein
MVYLYHTKLFDIVILQPSERPDYGWLLGRLKPPHKENYSMNIPAFNADKVTKFAIYALIGLAFYMSSRAFWGIEIYRFEIVITTTLMFACVSWLLSTILPTFLEVLPHSKPAAGVLSAIGLILFAIEITLVHAGLHWFLSLPEMKQASIAAAYTVHGAVGLSILNIFAKWCFLYVTEEVRRVNGVVEKEMHLAKAEEFAKALGPRAHRQWIKERLNEAQSRAN